jgi:hypothetical protein
MTLLIKFLVFWILLCLAYAAWAYPVLQQHPDNPRYIRIYNPDPVVWWCWAETGRGYIERYLRPGQATQWQNDIYKWGCEPA